MTLLLPCPGCGEDQKADEGHALCRSCECGRKTSLRAVTAAPGCDDWFHDDDGSHCEHQTPTAALTMSVAVDALTDALADYNVPTGRIIADFKRLAAEYKAEQ